MHAHKSLQACLHASPSRPRVCPSARGESSAREPAQAQDIPEAQARHHSSIKSKAWTDTRLRKSHPGCTPGPDRVEQCEETVTQVLAGEAIDSSFADRPFERPAPVVISALRVLSQSVIRRLLIGLITPDQRSDGAVIDRLFLSFWISEPSEHLRLADRSCTSRTPVPHACSQDRSILPRVT